MGEGAQDTASRPSKREGVRTCPARPCSISPPGHSAMRGVPDVLWSANCRGSPCDALRNISFAAAAWPSRARRLIRAWPRAALTWTGAVCRACTVSCPARRITGVNQGRRYCSRHVHRCRAGPGRAAGAVQAAVASRHVSQSAGARCQLAANRQLHVQVEGQTCRGMGRPGASHPLISFMMNKLPPFIRPLMWREAGGAEYWRRARRCVRRGEGVRGADQARRERQAVFYSAAS